MGHRCVGESLYHLMNASWKCSAWSLTHLQMERYQRAAAHCQTRIGKRCATDYALGFCTLTAWNGWNEWAIKAAFLARSEHWSSHGIGLLCDQGFLDSFIDLAIHLDKLIQNQPAYLLSCRSQSYKWDGSVWAKLCCIEWSGCIFTWILPRIQGRPMLVVYHRKQLMTELLASSLALLLT